MNPRLGIIGGGQLGLYLCDAAHALGMDVVILSDSAEDAALQFADRAIVGPLDSLPAINELLDGSDVITFDKEAIPDETLACLGHAEVGGRVVVHPGADTLLMLKDKALQKTWLLEQDLPTLPFCILAGATSPLALPAEWFGAGLVQKSRRGGYDGRGVQVLKHPGPAPQLWDVPSIVEPYLPDCREISVITVRDKSGDMQTYPPMSMEFDPELNSVRTVSLPADISPQLSAAAIALAESVVTKLAGVGVFAIEMFIAPGEKLLINEISPRVHNSGHVTLDACNVSQFEQHVRAVTGLPLVPIEAGTPAVMLNILYTDAMRDHCPAMPQAHNEPESETSVYWYGKAAGTRGRKMGHINARAATVELALASAMRGLAKLSSDDGERAA